MCMKWGVKFNTLLTELKHMKYEFSLPTIINSSGGISTFALVPSSESTVISNLFDVTCISVSCRIVGISLSRNHSAKNLLDKSIWVVCYFNTYYREFCNYFQNHLRKRWISLLIYWLTPSRRESNLWLLCHAVML